MLELYKDDRLFSQHHESQRTNGSGLVVAVAAGLLGFVSLDNQINASDIASSGLIIGLGVFGMIFTQKHYERSRLHLYRAYQYYHAINRAHEGVDIEQLRLAANAECEERFRFLNKIKLSSLWMMLHAIVTISGIFLLLQAFLSQDAPAGDNADTVSEISRPTT